MQLTLANHPVTEIHFGTQTRLDGTTLAIDPVELRRLVLEEEAIESVDLEIARPGESCRAGPIFDIIQPRAKEPGSSPDFPGILGPPTSAGMGTTHVLDGAAVSVLAERSPGESRTRTACQWMASTPLHMGHRPPRGTWPPMSSIGYAECFEESAESVIPSRGGGKRLPSPRIRGG